VENGFIFALDPARLYAAEVVNGAKCGGRNRARHAGKANAESALVDGFISGFDSPRFLARTAELGGRCAGLWATSESEYTIPNSPRSETNLRLR
jgi:hypothetical protein